MGKRVTTAELGDKLDKLIAVLTATAMAAPAAPVAQPEAETTELPVDAKYLAHQTEKAANHATAKGCEVVLYARKNKAGETKLAYALRDRYDEVITRQPSHLGAMGSFQP